MGKFDVQLSLVGDFKDRRFLDRPVDGEAVRRLLEEVKPLVKFSEAVFLETDKTKSALESVEKSLGSSLFSSLKSSLDSSRDSSLWRSLASSLRLSLASSLRRSLASSLASALKSSLYSSLWSSLYSSIKESLGSSLSLSLWRSLWRSLIYFCGFHYVGDAGKAKRLGALLDVWRTGACPVGVLGDGRLLVLVKSLSATAAAAESCVDGKHQAEGAANLID